MRKPVKQQQKPPPEDLLDRHERLLVDATLGRDTPGMTEAEREFKRQLKREIRAAPKGAVVDIP